MKKIKDKIMMFCAFLMLFALMGTPLSAFAQEVTDYDYSITIVKYWVPQGDSLLPNVTLTGVELERQPLQRMAGVTYRLIRMEEVDGEYLPMVGQGGFIQEAVTNANGVAYFGQLPRGIYQVIELNHQLIPEPAPPVIVHLPLRQNSGEFLQNVFIYPKSNVLVVDTPGGGDGHEGGGASDGTLGGTPGGASNQPPGQDLIKRLPQTSGNIGSILYLLMIGGGMLLVGGLGICLCKRRILYL